MTTPASGTIALSHVATEVGLGATGSISMSFIKTKMKSPPAALAMNHLYDKTFYARTVDGNCSNGNCNCAANCGNLNCTQCYAGGTVNCANCDGATNYLQANCNCACTYNCSAAQASFNCNCDCAPPPPPPPVDCDCGA